MVYQDDYKRPLDIWTEKNLRNRKWVSLISEEVSFLSLCLSKGLSSLSCLVLSLSSGLSTFSSLSLLLSLSCSVSLTCRVSHLFAERCPLESVSSYPRESRVYGGVGMRVWRSWHACVGGGVGMRV